jgi:hypothetical protein
MTTSETDDATRELAQGLMEGIAVMAPIFDAADGMRADLEKRGWSPTAAEAIAMEWTMAAMRRIWQYK